MMQEEKTSYDEPKTFGIAKYRLYYSAIVMVVIVGTMIFDKEPTPTICFAPVALLAVYLFLPFTYRLIVSDEAISSINLFGARTLEWNEVAEIKIKHGNLLLSNRDGDVKVTVNQQIDDYPEVIKFIRQQCLYLWNLDDIQTFHQNYLENSFTALVGLGITVIGIWVSIQEGFTKQSGFVLVGTILFSAILIVPGLLHIRKLSLDGDVLVVQYLIWKRQFHVKDVWSVSLEQEYGKNIVTYPVRIRIRNKKDIVIEKVKEGNPILVNAIEGWVKKHKGITN
jgi:hypothetical protein